jgi:hypothetical protein
MKEESKNTDNILECQSFDLEDQSTDSGKKTEHNKLISSRESTVATSEDYRLNPPDRYYGKNCAMFFKKGNPVVTIGPHCKKIHIIC